MLQTKPSLCAKPSAHWAPKPGDHGPLCPNKLLLDDKGVGDRVPKNMLVLGVVGTEHQHPTLFQHPRATSVCCRHPRVPPARTPYLFMGPTSSAELLPSHPKEPPGLKTQQKPLANGPSLPPPSYPTSNPHHLRISYVQKPSFPPPRPATLGKPPRWPVAALTKDMARCPTAPCSAQGDPAVWESLLTRSRSESSARSCLTPALHAHVLLPRASVPYNVCVLSHLPPPARTPRHGG